MGCACSYFFDQFNDLPKRLQTSNAVCISPLNLYRFLSEENPNPKCIFIFGGSGSNKGQFIWEILQNSAENYLNNRNNEIIKLIIEDENEIDFNRYRFSYYYVDVEKLIIKHLSDRIKKLAGNRQMVPSNESPTNYKNDYSIGNDLNEELLNETFRMKRRRPSQLDIDLKNQLTDYANIVTNSWILNLVKDEIKSNINGPFEKIFIINIIPNRITIFKNCLFLKQTPSFINFDFNYVAIKLVKQHSKRKDLEIKSDDYYDEINNNFVNYFRLINKLFEIQVKSSEDKIRLKLSTTKNAIRIANKDDLISFIWMPKKDQLELNIQDFRLNDFDEILGQYQTASLLFIINNEIDLEDNLKISLNKDRHYDQVFLRKFIHLYRLISYSLKLI
ncbi:hypothetical protein SSS_02885 [Sarcoptes scabiei]|uniref:Uncharacterized protein n=1 Tax=Sarcoptes scabiei TaxID=52283 RepID=A0A834RAC0_SARSC|nr:hypothetical protein SSS_02885 [Sarcoptes scabiei]